MSTRVHVCTKYEVEYSTYGDFKYNYPDFYNLLEVLSEVDGMECHYDPDNSPLECEIKRETYEQCIYKLEHYNDLDFCLKERVWKCMCKVYDNLCSKSNLPKYLKEIVKSMQMFLKLAPKKDTYIHFTAF